ncbi:hypothetical protein GCM10018952_34490 [Streptosporangium vulgare]
MSPAAPGRAGTRETGPTVPSGTGIEPPGPPHPLEWPVYDEGVAARVAELVTLGRTFDYDYGPELAELERSFAERHGRAHALALTSGTAGLLAAYFALGIGPGDEVIVPDLTFFSTASPLFLLGAVPVLCDAGDATGNVAAADVEALVTPRTVAIVVTHLWGHSCDMDALRAVADRRGLALVEDCSHAHGSTFRGRPVGSMGDISIFSVGGRKLVSGGMGGMLLTDSEDVFARACLLTNFRHPHRPHHRRRPLQAVPADRSRRQLPHLHTGRRARPEPPRPPGRAGGAQGGQHVRPVRWARRAAGRAPLPRRRGRHDGSLVRRGRRGDAGVPVQPGRAGRGRSGARPEGARPGHQAAARLPALPGHRARLVTPGRRRRTGRGGV